MLDLAISLIELKQFIHVQLDAFVADRLLYHIGVVPDEGFVEHGGVVLESVLIPGAQCYSDAISYRRGPRTGRHAGPRGGRGNRRRSRRDPQTRQPKTYGYRALWVVASRISA